VYIYIYIYKSMEICIRAWKYVQERGGKHKGVEVCQSVEVCVRAWKYI
jgi:hypothetical protein